MTISHKLTSLGITIATVGIIGLAPLAIAAAQQNSHTHLPSADSQQVFSKPAATDETPRIAGKPVRIEVPAAGINLTVVDGNFDTKTGEWTLSNDKAHFALPTEVVNNKSGNTLIYGHNTKQVFGPLLKLDVGAEAKVFTDNGHIFTYKLVAGEKVDPSNTAIFAYKGAPRLTLQTCTGVWSEARQFLYFELVSAQ